MFITALNITEKNLQTIINVQLCETLNNLLKFSKISLNNHSHKKCLGKREYTLEYIINLKKRLKQNGMLIF